jgi:hypothetical protein
MPLSNDEIQAIAMEVARIVLASTPPAPPCMGVCNLKREHIEGMGHMVGMVSDLGNGSFRVGVESIRESIKREQRQNKIVGTVTISTIVLIVGALVSGVVVAIAAYLKPGG